MYHLNFTQSLATLNFNANAATLNVIERDALQMAVLKLQISSKTSKTKKIKPELLIETANALLLKPKDPDGLRLFFATNGHEQTAPFDSLQNFAQFVLTQIRHFEELIAICAQEDSPEKLANFERIVDDLIETYSYVIDAAYGLRAQGLVPARFNQDLQKIANYSSVNASIFDRAFALHERRIIDDLSSDDSPTH